MNPSTSQPAAEAPTEDAITIAAPPSDPELEIKDAQLIFNSVWSEMESDFGKENLRFAKELILLGGAPGAGKSTQMKFILNARGLTCDSIVVSSLLNSPEAEKIKNQGGMVGDREVIGLVFRKLLDEAYRDGAVLDGFPRTKVQVECLKLLVSRMKQLRHEYYDTPLRIHFRQPTVHVMVLFVDETTSIERQLKRGQEIERQNQKARASGIGEIETRSTDLDPEAARHRYRVFKEKTWDALQSLKQTYFYHFINAQCSIEEVEQNILSELRYQSSLELNPQTFDQLRPLPLASDIVVHARQDLVKRLDNYEINHGKLFHQIIELIERKIMPVVIRHAISGIASVNTEDPVLNDPDALVMLIDIFSERGYHAVIDLHKIEIPEQIDLETGKITCRTKQVYRITIRFAGSEIRRG
ncbi:MAG: adenylate kinase [Verrucomicrobia subdivision 3 bacterium]|nr:adenylate kinase [Limisphaerales bacterium]MCS1416304.1 adenylate kinase [Limisphaerales bacterium]